MIDLSLIPPPSVVQALSFDTIVAEMLADFNARMLAEDPTWTTPPVSDPVYRLIEVVAYRELLLRQRVNDAAAAVLVASSTGTNLDNLVAFLGLTRDGRTDEELRTAWFAALDELSVAGPSGAYTSLARNVTGVKDALTYRSAPGTVRVVVLATAGDGSADAALLAAVVAALSDDEDVRPLTDSVEVVSATIIHYSITAEIEPDNGPDPEVLRATAQAAAQDYASARHALGRSITMVTLNSAITIDGIEQVTHSGVTADIVIGFDQAAYADVVAITLPPAPA